jgi:hypothetical protein
MNLETTSKVAQIIQNITVASASVIGGLWAFLRLYRERTYEGALKIDITAHTLEVEPKYTFVGVTLTNQGHSKLQANNAIGPRPVYSDRLDTILYSCSLEVKRINANCIAGDISVDWYNDSLLSVAIPEVDLFTTYRNPNNNQVEFWMEPGESYRLGSLLCLTCGAYLAKVTFIGSDCDEDFWTQLFYFQVPSTCGNGSVDSGGSVQAQSTSGS